MNTKMKYFQLKNTLFTVAMLVSFGAQAGNVASTFNPGDTLTATQMTEIKDAVNDNDTRVQVLEAAVGPQYQIVSAAFPYSLCGVNATTHNPICGQLRQVTCPAGTSVVGGGVDNPHFQVSVVESHPEGSTGWQAWVMNTSTLTQAGTMTVQAICANVTVSIVPRARNAATRDEGSVTALLDVSPDIRLEAVNNLWDTIRATSTVSDGTRLALENASSDPDSRVAELARQVVDFIADLEAIEAIQQ